MLPQVGSGIANKPVRGKIGKDKLTTYRCSFALSRVAVHVTTVGLGHYTTYRCEVLTRNFPTTTAASTTSTTAPTNTTANCPSVSCHTAWTVFFDTFDIYGASGILTNLMETVTHAGEPAPQEGSLVGELRWRNGRLKISPLNPAPLGNFMRLQESPSLGQAMLSMLSAGSPSSHCSDSGSHFLVSYSMCRR